MRRAALLLPLLAALAHAGDEQDNISCTTHCHGEQATAFRECVHKGELRCVDCHGGDPTAVRDKAKSHAADKGFKGRIARNEIPELCASCHSDPLRMHAYGIPTDQLAHYKASEHGRALFEKGDLSVAVCTDCHGSHKILPAHDPRAKTAPANQPETCGRCHSDPERMRSHRLPPDSVERFRKSVHGRALLEGRVRGVPSCADCHGAHGALPPGARNTLQVCANCHQETARHYRESPHAASEEMNCRACHDEPGARYERNDCAACHDAHAIAPATSALYEGDEPGRCDHCHRDGSADAARRTILDGTAQLEQALAETRHEIEEAKRFGVFLDNEHVELLEAQRTLVSIWPLSHSLDLEAVRAHLEQGLKRQDRTREVIAKKKVALRDRRILLSGLAGILALLAVLLAAKLRAVRELS